VVVDWASWLRRWEAQQSHYLPQREERFQVMIGLLRELAGTTPAVLDLGSGPGSLARRVVDWVPGARVVAIDADPLLLELGRQAVGDRGGSIRWLQADLRSDSWVETVRIWGAVDAALSTTALHWLSPREQADVFTRLAGLIRVGGILVNGDHLTFDHDQQHIAAAAKALQEEEADRDAAVHPAETWSEWWQAVEVEPAFASLVSERRSRWGGHPDYHSAGQALAMEAALKEAGFSEVGTIWQHFENRVLVAIR
jgi:trans-aconitate methyltransferase